MHILTIIYWSLHLIYYILIITSRSLHSDHHMLFLLSARTRTLNAAHAATYFRREAFQAKFSHMNCFVCSVSSAYLHDYGNEVWRSLPLQKPTVQSWRWPLSRKTPRMCWRMDGAFVQFSWFVTIHKSFTFMRSLFVQRIIIRLHTQQIVWKSMT